MDKLIKNYVAGAAVTKRRIVKKGAADENVILSAAATDASVGVSTDVSADSGERCDVVHFGITDVEAGGAIADGGFFTSDASGKAVAAAPGTGVNNRTVGMALETAAADGDIIRVFVFPGQVQG